MGYLYLSLGPLGDGGPGADAVADQAGSPSHGGAPSPHAACSLTGTADASTETRIVLLGRPCTHLRDMERLPEMPFKLPHQVLGHIEPGWD